MWRCRLLCFGPVDSLRDSRRGGCARIKQSFLDGDADAHAYKIVLCNFCLGLAVRNLLRVLLKLQPLRRQPVLQRDRHWMPVRWIAHPPCALGAGLQPVNRIAIGAVRSSDACVGSSGAEAEGARSSLCTNARATTLRRRHDRYDGKRQSSKISLANLGLVEEAFHSGPIEP